MTIRRTTTAGSIGVGSPAPAAVRAGFALLMMLLAWFPAAAQESAAGRGEQPAAAAAGGRCLVCEEPIRGDAHAEWHRGRRVTVCDHCIDEWRAHPDEHFARFEARGALFDERSLPARSLAQTLATGWLGFGIYVLAGLICGAAAAYVALGRGLRPLPWLLAALFFNFIALALLVTRRRGDLTGLPEGVPAGLRKIPVTRSPRICPSCGRANHPSARTCGGCATALESPIESEAARALRVPPQGSEA